MGGAMPAPWPNDGERLPAWLSLVSYRLVEAMCHEMSSPGSRLVLQGPSPVIGMTQWLAGALTRGANPASNRSRRRLGS